MTPNKTATYPELIVTQDTVQAILSQNIDNQTLLITDNHDYPGIPKACTHQKVTEQHAGHIEQVKRSYHYTSVVAVGGCTALDFGRACAVGKRLMIVPVVLSTSCLSTNRSVINYGGTYRTIIATAPEKTIVSLPEIMARHARPGNKWTGSGLGDLFSALGASVEFLYYQHHQSFEGITDAAIQHLVPQCVEALHWVATQTADSLYTPKSFTRIARYLHESSLDVLRNNHTRLNAASEHKLYYALQEQQRYQKHYATHGQLVSIGTLLTLRILTQHADSTLYKVLRKAYAVLDLPLNYADLQAIGVTKQHLLQALQPVAQTDSQFYRTYVQASLLDEVFV